MTAQPRTSRSWATGPRIGLAVALVALGVAGIGLFWSRAQDSWGYRAAEYEEAIGKAVAWIDRLPIDPVALQAQGVKGKKKLAEALDAYMVVLRYEDDPDKAGRYRERIRQLAATTDQPGYHNLLTCDGTEFNANSMSYLRVMWLMQRFGLDTSRYMDEVRRVKGRLDQHLIQRGVWQRAMFARYYDGVGLEKPPVLLTENAAPGLVVGQLPIEQYDRIRAYQLVHEVFVAFDYGHDETQVTFTARDLDYLAGALPALIDQNIQMDDADLLSELVVSMALLGWRDAPATKRGVDYLLEHQNDDGTWGDYETERARVGDLVDQQFYLHTTRAAVQALLETYERRPGPAATP